MSQPCTNKVLLDPAKFCGRSAAATEPKTEISRGQYGRMFPSALLGLSAPVFHAKMYRTEVINNLEPRKDTFENGKRGGKTKTKIGGVAVNIRRVSPKMVVKFEWREAAQGDS